MKKATSAETLLERPGANPAARPPRWDGVRWNLESVCTVSEETPLSADHTVMTTEG